MAEGKWTTAEGGGSIRDGNPKMPLHIAAEAAVYELPVHFLGAGENIALLFRPRHMSQQRIAQESCLGFA